MNFCTLYNRDLNCSFCHAAPFLSCGTSFLLLFVFLCSLVLHHHQVFHHQTLTLDWLLTSLVAFFTLVVKPSFSQNLSLCSHVLLPQAIFLAF